MTNRNSKLFNDFWRGRATVVLADADRLAEVGPEGLARSYAAHGTFRVRHGAVEVRSNRADTCGGQDWQTVGIILDSGEVKVVVGPGRSYGAASARILCRFLARNGVTVRGPRFDVVRAVVAAKAPTDRRRTLSVFGARRRKDADADANVAATRERGNALMAFGERKRGS